MNALFARQVLRKVVPNIRQFYDKTRAKKLIPKHERIPVCLRRLRKYRKKEDRLRDEEIEKFLLPPERKIEYDLQSISARGFCRGAKGYTPVADVRPKVFSIAERILGEVTDLNDSYLKFKFLTACIGEFSHDIPNSQMHKMTTVEATIGYFETPVKSSNTFDDLVKADLPPNLHIQQHYVRFHPDTDTMFGGVSAFPYSSTIVTGLKAKKLYKGHDARPLTLKLKE